MWGYTDTQKGSCRLGFLSSELLLEGSHMSRKGAVCPLPSAQLPLPSWAAVVIPKGVSPACCCKRYLASTLHAPAAG